MGEYARIDDLNVIRSMGKGLGEIKDSFTGLSKLVANYGEDFGEPGLQECFKEFVENWEINRERLTEEVASLASIAKSAAESYESIDRQLAQSLRDAKKKKGS